MRWRAYCNLKEDDGELKSSGKMQVEGSWWVHRVDGVASLGCRVGGQSWRLAYQFKRLWTGSVLKVEFPADKWRSFVLLLFSVNLAKKCPCTKAESLVLIQGPHSQPPSAWIRVIRSLLAVPSRHARQPPRWRRYLNCAICAHSTAFVGRPLLNGESVLLRKITNKSLAFPKKNAFQQGEVDHWLP
ncbi:hypothetical protein CDAR_285521 [Caerostris darwini]|uniref:Uncharacterized protein n=1 Tax=Caerostris darwini TaxID=1538125 RepID=A0AAV4RES5_9ARAC|nr:hypothetical protein CDAR_285521 [Caerostris darwini]